MSHFSDALRQGSAGTPTDASGRRLPAPRLLPYTVPFPNEKRYNYAYGGAQTQPSFYWDNNSVAPVAIAATGVIATATVAAGGSVTLNGTLVTGGVAVFDTPRCVSVVTSNAGNTTQTVTVVGTDVDGQTLTSTVTVNGVTTVNTKKAFLTVTSVTVSAAITGTLSAGTSDVFGLYWAVKGRRQVQFCWGTPPNGDIQITTGTLVAADTTSPATALTGDVRGTFAVPSASNGTNILAYEINMNQNQVDNVNLLIGVAQF